MLKVSILIFIEYYYILNFFFSLVGKGVRLQRCVIMDGSRIRDHSWIQSTIVGWNCTIGRWVRIENIAVLGDDVVVKDEIHINGASVLPHKSISASINEPKLVAFTISLKFYLT